MILVTGVNGQLGYDVVKELKNRNIECIGAGRKDFDITDEQRTKSFIKIVSPEAVIHCAAYTAVDKAEDEPKLCQKVNAFGTKFIAEACKEINAKMIYISTDYIFSGLGHDGLDKLGWESGEDRNNDVFHRFGSAVWYLNGNVVPCHSLCQGGEAAKMLPSGFWVLAFSCVKVFWLAEVAASTVT